MPRPTNRLSHRTVITLSTPGLHADGAGLYLRIDPTGAKRWVFLFRRQGKRTEMGLGGLLDVSLAKAREKAKAARDHVVNGRDPIEERDRPAAGPAPPFGEIADGLIASLKFRNDKHKAQWEMTLREYAGPLRSLPVDQVSTDDVVAVLQPLWDRVPETASRTRGRIERVLDAAKARGLRAGDNPARWKGHLALLLAARPKLSRGHHAAMPFADAPAFMADLRARVAPASYALELTILTAARSGETLCADWSEFSRDGKVWTVPAERMKGGREHRAALSTAAIAVLDRLASRAGEGWPSTGYVFPGQRPGRPLSNMAMEMLLRRMKMGCYTVHGFRSTFRDWAGESTTFPRELAEAALAHLVGDETERAYRRADALEKRRKLMEAWAKYLIRG